MLSDSHKFPKESIEKILKRLKDAFPKRYVTNAKTFEGMWNSKRKDIEKEADEAFKKD